jgi:hypothetical protein
MIGHPKRSGGALFGAVELVNEIHHRDRLAIGEPTT